MLVHIVSHVKHENRQNLVMFVQIIVKDHFKHVHFIMNLLKHNKFTIYEVCYVLRALELLYIYLI